MKKLFYLYLISLTIVIRYFVNDENLNYFLIGSMMLLSFVGLFIKAYIKTDSFLPLLMILIMFLFSFLAHRESFRSSTILYSLLFVTSFLSYTVIWDKSKVKISSVMKLIKYIIYAYAIVLFIQQIQSFSGMTHVFNLASDFSSKWKLNSLSMESSNTAMIIPLLMYCYIRLQELLLGEKLEIKQIYKRDKKIIIIFLYVTLTNGAMTALFTLPIFCLYFLRVKDIKYIIGVVIFGFGLAMGLKYAGVIEFDRITKVINAFFTFDINTIVDVDPSAACRIVPYFNYINAFNPLDPNFWIGHGIDSAETLADYQILAIGEAKEGIGAMNIFSTFYDYGFIMTISFVLFVYKFAITKVKSFDTLIYVLLYSVVPFNHYMLWIFLAYMFLVKRYGIKYKFVNENNFNYYRNL